MKNDFREIIAQFLGARGIQYRFQPRAKHDAVEFDFNGKTCTFVFPRTGSDWRGPANAITHLKRLIGLTSAANDNKNVKPQRQSKRRRAGSRRSRLRLTAVIESPVVRVDRWFSHLQVIHDRLVAAEDVANVLSGANDNGKTGSQSLFSAQDG